MFDYHLHTTVSFDGISTAQEIATAAVQAGLKEICFTDHYDFHFYPDMKHNLFTPACYSTAYDLLNIPNLTIRRGVEFGLTTWNQSHLEALLQTRSFDFVIGSVHYPGPYDPYEAEYWEGISIKEAFTQYLEGILNCVKVHHNFDVLGHLTYVCKSPWNTSHQPVPFKDYQEITDEIMRLLVSKGIGMEINTSGIDCVGVFLPDADYLKRFKELGGEIITIGSDAHNVTRVGQYSREALAMLKEIFGYVCTFENRQVKWNKL